MAKPDLSAQSSPDAADIIVATQPEPEEYKGVYKNVHDGLLYELAKLDEDKSDPNKKTHRLRVPPQVNKESGSVTHPGFYWEGTKEQFKSHFEKP